MAIIQNFSISAGETRDLAFNLVEPQEPPVSFAGAEVWFQVFEERYAVPEYMSEGSPAPAPVILKSTANGGIDPIDSPEDIFTVHLLPVDTVSLLGNYYFEARVEDLNQDQFIVAKGIMSVQPTLSMPI